MNEFARKFAAQRKPAPPPERPKRATRQRPIPRVSKRMKAIKADTDGPREEFVEAVGECMVEGCPNPPMPTTHEITCGNGREAALYQPRMQMAVCNDHHNKFHNDVAWTKKRQLATRVRWELKQFCKEFCENRGVALSDFPVEELIDYLMYQQRYEIPKKKRKAKA